MLAAKINIRMPINIQKWHLKKNLQLCRHSSNILIYLLIVLRDLDSDYRETLCNYLNLRTALLSWSLCHMLRHFRMYLWAVRNRRESSLLEFYSRIFSHVFSVYLRCFVIIMLRERSHFANNYLFTYSRTERTNPQRETVQL